MTKQLKKAENKTWRDKPIHFILKMAWNNVEVKKKHDEQSFSYFNVW